MNILVVSSKPDFGPILDGVVAQVRARLAASGKAGTVKSASEIDWNGIRVALGGWDKAYVWAGKSHDVLVIVPVGGSGTKLSRGVLAMAQAAIVHGRSVLIASAGVIGKVRRVIETGGRWQDDFGEAEVAGATGAAEAEAAGE